jgi:cobalt/nickel transport system permease protein
MQPIHLAIGLVEGLITAAVLTFVYETRPELLRDVDVSDKSAYSGQKSLTTVIASLAVAAVLVGGIFSHFASSNPDGLEWALFGNAEEGYAENMGLDEENFGTQSTFAEKAESVQDKTSFLPDYAFSQDAENPAGTTVSGILGSLMVAVCAAAVCFAGRFFRKKNSKKVNE